ncbi:ABC transporter ATP-binding protein [Streptomyces hiroshimensis]|uniref:ABC transporter ATP-binding protein n=1 Tax=Streptomyces hiroshimensis TaxID=66424 RepID=A0ABQ2Y5R3_9ACTN|nr:ATP-binding cassette domain-containing protein [Streptomyces hiroshimensis]GGX65756.1 ABC transporter ATP-binding protein [Streptomyces hiroshimensis]
MVNGPEDAVAEVRGLRVVVPGGRAIVDGVSLTARPGRVTALVGASGSGKTTTGLALLGAYPPGAQVTGEVRVAEGLTGYVPQHPASVLNPARRVSALLYDIARRQVRELPRGERREAARARVRGALRDAQLPGPDEVLARYPHQLSGGQQQRVVLAQALLLGARVVVADEPTTGQDPRTKERVAAQLAAVARRGIAVVLLSHDLDVVRALADEVLVMREGKVVDQGTPEEIWAGSRRQVWTRELLEEGETGAEGFAAGEDDGAGAPDRPPVLEARSLTARHPGAPGVLRDVSFAVHPGECVAVVGPSGSGKTTLGRCLAGLHPAYDGVVTLEGAALPRSLRRRSTAELAAVQYVFQDARAAFDEHRAVLGQVARTAVRLRGLGRGAAEEEARALLARMGLGADHAERRPGELSGGELQRAALARALLARPRVLICDEVTSGLDVVTRRGILDLLTALVREPGGPGLVLITHDTATAAVAGRTVVVEAGRVRERAARSPGS